MVFSVLVIPAVIAFFFTQQFARALWLAYGVGTAAIVLGLLVSFTMDWATGPVLVCSFGFFLLLALLLRPWFGVRVKSPEEARLVVRLLADGGLDPALVPEASEKGEVAAVVPDGIGLLGGLKDLRDLQEPIVQDDPAEGLRPQGSLPQVLVPVLPGGEGVLGVVHVEEPETLQAKNVGEPLPDPFVIPHQVVARGVGVAGVEADAHPALEAPGGTESSDRRKVLEGASDGGAAPGGELQENPGGALASSKARAIPSALRAMPLASSPSVAFPGCVTRKSRSQRRAPRELLAE